MSCSTLIILRPCLVANLRRSGRRAMVPSERMISHSTAAGYRPAIFAMSTPASVWPARTRTPPSRARSGNRCPGITRSSRLVLGSRRTFTVRALSGAETPLVTPWRASTGTVKGVPKCSVFSPWFIGMPSSATRSGVSEMHTKPRAWVAMKLMCSAVTNWAGIARSPSFSRSSSSQMITMRPARNSSMASSTVAMTFSGSLRCLLPARGPLPSLWLDGRGVEPGEGFAYPLQVTLVQELLDIAGDYVGFQVYAIARAPGHEDGVLLRVRHEADGERALGPVDDRKRDAV